MDIKNISYRILQNNGLTKGKETQAYNSKIHNFEDILKNEEIKQNLKFSKHAVERMQTRDINLNTNEILRIEEAVNKASTKGVKEALILMDDKAFIANIKNKTIVTSVNKEQLKNNIFTNIDGAIII
ncbi:TIGR02530 family flagellar biosynthesis protein [Proteiniborus sp. DW1]|uniref:TIGR02530 family flagellar biosynthesis protein n=1 Tax=Proteiniborus sp. DW1 TaxID=1889883 RepID=UPI001FA869B6|nr:TIGR02530 family flagellar biosynthesis protein [Proteiniborus sp. DW1]